MFRNKFFLVLAAVLLLALAGGLAAQAEEIPQEPAGKTDVPSALVNPAVIYLLKDLESQDPANTIFRLEEGSATAVSTSGNLNRVGEYLPLQNGVTLRRLFFRKALANGVLSVNGDSGSFDDRRLVARYSEPQLFDVEVRDTRVLHRLEHRTNGLDEDTRSKDQYLTNWERTELTGSVALADLPVRAFVRSDNQSRMGKFQHTWFQIHRTNCTGCHTMSSSAGMSELTRTFEAGLSANPGKRTFLAASAGSSYYNDKNTTLLYNFGGPFGYSPVSLNLQSRDELQNAQGATGGEIWRVSAQFNNTDRRNQVTGNTLKGRFFSGQGVIQPIDQLQFVGGFVNEDQSRSLASNLSYNRTRAFVERNYAPVQEFYASARAGQNETRYNSTGYGLQNYKESYYELRGGCRPARDVRLNARWRADAIANPYFPTDPTSRTLIEASASWSPDPVTVGIDYRNSREAGPLYATREETGLGYVAATWGQGWGANATYSETHLDSNSANNFYLDDPTGTLLALQKGLPFTATLKTLTAGIDIPFGTTGYRLRPTYRRTDSDSQTLLMPNFPVIPADSKLKLEEETVGLRFDLPSWDNGRLGVGWERQNWRDKVNNANDGTFNLFMINYSTRY